MRKTALAFGVFLLAATSFGYVGITDIHYNEAADTLEIDVEYGGGCRSHQFSLDLTASSINEDNTAHVSFHLNHRLGADDPCRALIFERLYFPMTEVTTRPAVVYISTNPDGSHPFVIDIEGFPKADIISAYYDRSANEIVADIRYTGGCLDHDFDLRIDRCATSYPPRCTGWIDHVKGANDACDDILHTTKRFFLEPHLIPSVLTLTGLLDNRVVVEIKN